MRYYHYGNKCKDGEVEINQDRQENFPGNVAEERKVYNSSLIIEEDTVYEIDEDCRCGKMS